MKPKDKANELILKFSDHVSGYIGSSMLTNTEYPEVILMKSKQCALIAVDEILNLDDFSAEGRYYYDKVKSEINNL